MFLHELGSSDARFKKLKFHDGMNILLADKTDESIAGDSRNGAGKTSFIKILRYILGSRIDNSLKSELLKKHFFWAKIELNNDSDNILIQRPVSPQTQVYIDGNKISINEWKQELSSSFNIPGSVIRPTVSQLFGQLVREHFGDPLKIYSAESEWETGTRIGFFLGLSPEILSKAGEITALEKNRKALSKAISDGVLGSITLSESELRSQLAQTRKKRSQLESNLSGFRVDEQYTEHQEKADVLTHEIRRLNDEAVVLEQRKRDLNLAMAEESPSIAGTELAKRLENMYAEIGIVLPDVAIRRFHEVAEFHASVVKNRQMYLQAELKNVNQRLTEISSERKILDEQRATAMNLLNDSMALETFYSLERELTNLDSLISDFQRKLELVQSISDTGIRLRTMKSEAEASIRAEIADRELYLEKAIVLFQHLGQEIYNDRNLSLLIEATSRGMLKINPKIDGDASAGILGVKTFLLDMVCIVSAIQLGRAPRILVHDSQLFDSMDDRQIASCLRIGAQLAHREGFQYIVTLNSDRLSAAESEGFSRMDYVIEPILTDAGEEGGLFGFRFV